MRIKKVTFNTLGDSEGHSHWRIKGACPAHFPPPAPTRVQILSFRHTKFSKCDRLGSKCPKFPFFQMRKDGSQTVRDVEADMPSAVDASDIDVSGARGTN